MTEEERYKQIANERQVALDKSNKTYEDLLNQNTAYSNSVNDYLKNYQNIQNEQLDKQTQFQVDLQNQNKENAEKEYQKEAMASKNAYYDFINPYGVQREIQAQNGLNRSGYSETTKSQAWTTQQNRTAQAKANLNQAKLQFDNAIKEAYLNNDANKAQLALEILQQQQQEALRSFNYTSDTKLNQLNNSQNLDSEYNNRYNTLYNQIQQEKATAEAIRQYNQDFEYQKEKDRLAREEAIRQYNENLALQKAQFEYQKQQDAIANQLAAQRSYSSGYSSSGRSSSSSSSSYDDLSDNTPQKTHIVTDYYDGYMTDDQEAAINKYGAFNTQDKNGVKYQPAGVIYNGQDYGTISKARINGNPIKVGEWTARNDFTNSSGVNVANQSVWMTGNGQAWVWNGSKMTYEPIGGYATRLVAA